MASGALNLTAFDYALKELYTEKRVQALVYKKNPLFAMIAKWTKWEGDKLVVPVQYGHPQSITNIFSTAQANRSTTSGVKFELTRVKKYGVVNVDRETMKASASDAGAFIRARKNEIDNMFSSFGRAVSKALYRDGSGVLGRLSAIASDVGTLGTVHDAANFEVGMILEAATTSAATTIRAGDVEIEAIDEDLGTITTVEATWATGIAAITATDFLVVAGTGNTDLKGLASWIPSAAPTSTAFFGVDRTAHVTRLGGNRYTGTSVGIEEAFQTLLSRVQKRGGAPDHIFCSHNQYLELDKALGTKVHFVDPMPGGDVNFGFQGIKITGASGPVTVVPDINCPDTLAYALQMDNWRLPSLGPVPEMVADDGLTMVRATSADEFEIRCAAYLQMECNAPGNNGVVTLNATT